MSPTLKVKYPWWLEVTSTTTLISCPSLYVLVMVPVAYFPGWVYRALPGLKWWASPHTPHFPLFVDHCTLNPPQLSSLSVSCLGVSKPYLHAEFLLGGSISRPWPETRATILAAIRIWKIASILGKTHRSKLCGDEALQKAKSLF